MLDLKFQIKLESYFHNNIVEILWRIVESNWLLSEQVVCFYLEILETVPFFLFRNIRNCINFAIFKYRIVSSIEISFIDTIDNFMFFCVYMYARHSEFWRTGTYIKVTANVKALIFYGSHINGNATKSGIFVKTNVTRMCSGKKLKLNLHANL